MTDQPPRFMVRKGTRNYMIWDRLRRGPAKLFSGQIAIGLEREEAIALKDQLVLKAASEPGAT